jgi:hypothetical protein
MSSLGGAAEIGGGNPPISAAGYKAISQIHLDNILYQKMPPTDTPDGSVVFVDFKSNKRAESVFQKWSKSFVAGSKLKFIFSNGDDTPSIKLRKMLTGLGHQVFSVNVFDNEPGVTPIPLGIRVFENPAENESLRLVYEYLSKKTNGDEDRNILVYTNFSLYDNGSDREDLKQKMEKTRFGFFDSRLSQKEYFNKVLRSKLVISPRGMSPDCHRTWEAISLGAVPVILRGTLADSITSELPVWVVDSWEEVTGSSDKDLNKKFLDLKERAIDKALIDYWKSAILNNK